jgi:5-methylcytosine-specific restriction protein A
MEPVKDKQDWSYLEIQAAVDSYTRILEREQHGEKVNKAYENSMLRGQILHTRTHGSVEFRMRNISAVFADLGRQWVKGYSPAKNVGSNVRNKILHALGQREVQFLQDRLSTADEEILEQRAAKLEKNKLLHIPKGISRPQLVEGVVKTFVRDPEVRAWVRQQANGVCDGCGQRAPFEIDGAPFLEIHHVKHLARGGSDLVTNAVALCPNCHRRCHHSSDREDFNKSLYERVHRLVEEP